MLDLLNIEPQVNGDVAAIAGLADRMTELVRASKAKNTIRMYDSQWRQYIAWCNDHKLDPLVRPARVAAAYIAHLSLQEKTSIGKSSINSKLSAIRAAYRAANVSGLDDPFLTNIEIGAKRSVAGEPVRKALPATPSVLRRLLAAVEPHTEAVGARDRAMLMIGFAAALRRSEIVALRVRDVSVRGDRMRVYVRQSKTDQNGDGRFIGIVGNKADPEFCPIVALARWMEHRGKARPDAALFVAVPTHGAGINPASTGITDKTFVRAIAAAAQKAGIDDISGHSLRRGFMTAAAEAQVGLSGLMNHSRHTHVRTAMGYMDQADVWANNVPAAVFNAANNDGEI